jgi:hypothetical protein
VRDGLLRIVDTVDVPIAGDEVLVVQEGVRE